MTGILTGIVGVALWTWAVVVVILPLLFSLVHGLFDNSDTGTIAALVACFFALGPIVWVYALIILLAAAVGGATSK